MSNTQLPDRPSLEFLRKLAKDRLRVLRETDSKAKLADALLAVAREHGFASWRALKAHVESRTVEHIARFIAACKDGHAEIVAQLLKADPDLARARDAEGSTGLHAAAARGHVDVVRLLLRYGADPNARDTGDNASPLHFAAGGGHLETTRALLDAGADVHGHGDLHEADVIGWPTMIPRRDAIPSAVVSLLLERGARHHIFSALAMGDPDLVRHVVEENPAALERRTSRFEHGQTPLHFAVNRHRYDLLDVLIELGADLEARDLSGRTALEAAMMYGDQEAMRLLRAAGAEIPPVTSTEDFSTRMSTLTASVSKGVPMISVPDVAKTLAWYASIGFREITRFDENGIVNFGMVAFGRAEVMFNLYGSPSAAGASLWFYTNQIDAIYQMLKTRQLESARAALDATTRDHHHPRIEFDQDIEDMFYDARQFSIRDPNGYVLYFIQTRD
jgi:ankyrin repeat protein